MVTQDTEEFKIKIETLEETEARLERIIAAWAEDDEINQQRLARVFERRFDGQLWPDEYRFDPHRGHWMEWKGSKWYGRWQPAATIMNDVGALIERLCEDKPSLASKWLKVNVYKDVLTLAKEYMTVDTWDADGDLMGLPNGDVWDLEMGWGEPNFQRLHVTKTTGVDPDTYQSSTTCKHSCKCLWHSFLYDVTGGDYDMQEGLQISIGASMFAGNRDHRLNVAGWRRRDGQRCSPEHHHQGPGRLRRVYASVCAGWQGRRPPDRTSWRGGQAFRGCSRSECRTMERGSPESHHRRRHYPSAVYEAGLFCHPAAMYVMGEQQSAA